MMNKHIRLVVGMAIMIGILSLVQSALWAAQSNESLANKIESYANTNDPRYTSYAKQIFGSNIYGRTHIRYGYNNGSTNPSSILDITTPAAASDEATLPSLKFTNSNYPDNPSIIHYKLPGHWIIQSGSIANGIVYLQPRGGTVQIGSSDTAISDYTKKYSSGNTTSFNVYAKTTRFYKNVTVYNPENAGESISVYDAVSRIQQTDSIQSPIFIDRDNITFSINPSENSTIHTLDLNSFTDRQRNIDNQLYKVDLNNKSNLYSVRVEGTFRLPQSTLRFKDRNDEFIISANASLQKLVFTSTTTNVNNGKIRMNRTFIINTSIAKKVNLFNLSTTNNLHGIYAGSLAALTASSNERLYINPKNQFGILRIGNPALNSANVVVHGTTTAAKEFVGYGMIPKGGIIAWNGNGAAVPQGWALCDGRTLNGMTTPDLRDRFIVATNKNAAGTFYTDASGGSYKVTDTGGTNYATLSIEQMPSHKHSWNDFAWSKDEDDGQWGSCCGDIGWYYNSAENTETTGNGEGHENRPPYYALAFIMRVQ